MPLPTRLRRELDGIGFLSESQQAVFEMLWDRDGEEAFRGHFDNRWEAVERCREWAPRLWEYAINSRTESPLPTRASLSDLERAKYEVYCKTIHATIGREGSFRPRSDVVRVLRSSPVGLLALHDVIGPPSNTVVHILDEEMGGFDQFDGDPEWYTLHWWSIAEVDDEHPDAETIAADHPEPVGFRYWTVNDGFDAGCWVGEVRTALWQWDGTVAQWVASIGHIMW